MIHECTFQNNLMETDAVRVHPYIHTPKSHLNKANISQPDNKTGDILKEHVKLLQKTQDDDHSKDKFSEMPNTTSQFKVEKLLTHSGKSIYVMHFINFNDKETVLMRLLVQIINFYMSNNL